MTAPTAGQEPWERRSRRDARPSPPCVFPQRCTCEMKASMKLVFQYGSNCDTSEFNSKERLAGRAFDLGPAQTVNTFEIAFNKYSKNRGCAAAVLISRKRGRRVWGVLCQISDEDFTKPRTRLLPLKLHKTGTVTGIFSVHPAAARSSILNSKTSQSVIFGGKPQLSRYDFSFIVHSPSQPRQPSHSSSGPPARSATGSRQHRPASGFRSRR